MESEQIKIIFWGTPEFGVPALKKLIENGYKITAVITNPDEKIGRKQILTPPPVKVFAQKYGIPVFQPEKLSAFGGKIPEADLYVVAAYGKIIPKEIIESPGFGSLNIHPSLLPRWRGPSPVQYAILNGDQETGVTIMLMDEKMDHGPILADTRYKIQDTKITTPELSNELSELGAKLLVDTIPKWVRGEIKPMPQDETHATYSKILKKEDGKIDWQKSAEEIERMIRAFQPWPGSFGFWQKAEPRTERQTMSSIRKRDSRLSGARGEKKVKLNIEKADLADDFLDAEAKAGSVLIKNYRLLVKTGSGFLEVSRIQPEGSRVMTAEEFINGHGDINKAVLE